MTTRFQISDATCGHCKATVESAVSSLPDVSGAELDLETKQLTVEHGASVDADKLSSVITEAGYTPEPVA